MCIGQFRKSDCISLWGWVWELLSCLFPFLVYFYLRSRRLPPPPATYISLFYYCVVWLVVCLHEILIKFQSTTPLADLTKSLICSCMVLFCNAIIQWKWGRISQSHSFHLCFSIKKIIITSTRNTWWKLKKD